VTSAELDRRFTRIWLVVFAAIVVTLLVGGYAYYRSETARIRKEKLDGLQTIGALKAAQVERWRKERLAQANGISKSPFVRRAVADLAKKPGDDGLRADLRERLALEMQDESFAGAALLDLEGKPVLATSDDADLGGEATRQAVALAVSDHEAKLSDLYRSVGGVVRLDVATPVVRADGRLLGVVVLHSDAAAFLFSLIQSWPTPSPSAETLLIQRSGADALYLNDLRHRAQTALSLRIPLIQTDVPAVQAVLGKRGTVEGPDYRGVEVLADVRPVAGSDWFLVAKVDADEMLAEARSRAEIIVAFVALGILLAAAWLVVVYRQREAHVLRSLYDAERQEREAEEQFRATLYSIGDGVITTDRHACVTHMNPVAETLTGWPEADARGKPLGEVFHILDEETRAEVQGPAERVLRAGQVVGLANHALLVARDGVERPIVDSGAPIKGEGGAVTGVVLVFRDRTSDRVAESALRQSEARFRGVFEHASVGKSLTGSDGTPLQVNRAFADMLGYGVEEMRGVKAADITHPDDVAETRECFRSLFAGERATYRTEKRYLHRTGRIVWADVSTTVLRDPANAPLYLITTIIDITERKRAEDALRASETRYRRLFESAKDGILILDAETGVVVDVNPFLTGLLGTSREEIVGKRVWELGFLKDTLGNQEKFAELQRESYVRYEDLPLETAEGRAIAVEFVSNVYPVSGKNVIQCNIRDITERKRTEGMLRNQMEELRRWQDVMLGREDRVQELKREVNELCRRAGEPVRYRSPDAASPDGSEPKRKS
jgi:PAS domain S-box-containing protein